MRHVTHKLPAAIYETGLKNTSHQLIFSDYKWTGLKIALLAPIKKYF